MLVSGNSGDARELDLVGVSAELLGDSDPADKRAPNTCWSNDLPSSVGWVRISLGIRMHHSPRQLSRLNKSRFSSSFYDDDDDDEADGKFFIVKLAKVLKLFKCSGFITSGKLFF